MARSLPLVRGACVTFYGRHQHKTLTGVVLNPARPNPLDASKTEVVVYCFETSTIHICGPVKVTDYPTSAASAEARIAVAHEHHKEYLMRYPVWVEHFAADPGYNLFAN